MNTPRLCPKCHTRPTIVGGHGNYTLAGNPSCDFCWLRVPHEETVEQAVNAWNRSFSETAARDDGGDCRPIRRSAFSPYATDEEDIIAPLLPVETDSDEPI